jgi:subtilisin family serine protease
LDRQSGHGTFIAGIIRRIAPDAEIWTEGVLSSFGDGDDYDISAGLTEALTRSKDLGPDGGIDIVNMSFGSFTANNQPHPVLLKAVQDAQAQGAVVVAAAGNAASCQEFWPACIRDVVSVGATYCGERAWFSNFGDWVTVWAPGVDIVSTFFTHDGPAVSIGGLDPDEFLGWAEWSGTSFAAPHVAAMIAKRMSDTGESSTVAKDAVLGSATAVSGLGLLVDA